MKQTMHAIGQWGEKLAAEYLCKHGYKILEHNYHSRYGEIDLIAIKGGVVSFVEVKLRKNNGLITPYEAVDYRKQEKLIKTAEIYLNEHYSEEFNYSFDVISIIYYSTDIFSINHLKGAFES